MEAYEYEVFPYPLLKDLVKQDDRVDNTYDVYVGCQNEYIGTYGANKDYNDYEVRFVSHITKEIWLIDPTEDEEWEELQ